MRQSASQWAFSAVTGYEIPCSAFSSASVEGWKDMSREQLIEEIEGQLEFNLSNEDFLYTEVDAEEVADAIFLYKKTEDQDSSYAIYTSLVKYAVSDADNGIYKDEVFETEAEADVARERWVAEGIVFEKDIQEETELTDEEIEEKVRGYITIEEV